MGPRLFSRGMSRNVKKNHRMIDASMGPRLFSRGMEIDLDPKYAGWLQWGRDFSAAECVFYIHDHCVQGRFNGAATFQPRNGLHDRVSQMGHRDASMGPRLFSRGMHVVAYSKHPGPVASMGPRLFSRGMVLSGPGTVADCGASMGPRLFSRGMISSQMSPNASATTLQWGRDFSAAE